MAGVHGISERVVALLSGIGMYQDVDMGCSSSVVAGENGCELRDTVVVRLLDAAQERSVEVGRVRRVAVALGHDARVDARGVAVPDFNVDVRDWVACIYVNDLVVKEDVDTCLIFGDILADVFAADVYKPGVSSYTNHSFGDTRPAAQ